jgi:DNA-binding LacI/PurR family transcriptional regulator
LRPDTLARVQHAIEALGYTPNRAARHLRTGSSRLIGLRMPAAQEYTANAAMDRFIHALVEASREAGYHVLLFSGGTRVEGVRPDPLAGYDALLRSTAVDAFVVTDTYLGNPQASWLTGRRAPFVAFGRAWGDSDAAHPWVDVDGAAGTRLATGHVLERGYQRVAWLGWQAESHLGEDRRAGWEQVMASHGLPTDGLAIRTADTVHAGRVAAAQLLDTVAPDAIVCASDTLAVGVLHILAERGLCPGRDIGVVGYDDSQVAQVVPPGLTSVRQPLEQVAVEIVRALRALLAQEPYDASGVLLAPTLAIRGSTAR